MGRLIEHLKPILTQVTGYMDSLGPIRKVLVNAWLGSTPVYGTVETEDGACTFKVTRGPQVVLVEGKVKNPDAVMKLPMSVLEAMYGRTLKDFDDDVSRGVIKITVHTGRGLELVRQVRAAFGDARD